jgi:hypothetical protein
MEAEFLSLGLDIIGLGVFNYDFGSITAESPVIKVGGRGRCNCAGGQHEVKDRTANPYCEEWLHAGNSCFASPLDWPEYIL